ncbi:alkaline phosphatase family protein [Micromonospora sp. NPDC050397]|uniref:alkaline phosphatase family protein n=1 Tax=Micromonospora sp. NPDC050397 TaxID=3364279 RepID=UPI00384B5C7E
MARSRAIVLIAEGVETSLVARWGPERLPNFHRLFAEGAGGLMHSEFVPYEPSGLFTAFTGVEPATHGCFSYWEVHTPDYVPRVLDSGDSRRPFLWHRPELGDRTVAVINVFGTHPVQPVNGHVISYPMRSTLHACHPRDLPIQLAEVGIKPVHDVTVWFAGQPKSERVPLILGADEQRAAAALHLLRGGLGTPPDLTIVNMTAIDRLSHFYWQELEPGSQVAEDDQAIFQAYQLCDRLLGELLDLVDGSTSLFCFSEIGFGPLRSYQSVNDVLAKAGLLTYAADGVIDFTRTRAFEAVQGAAGVNLNLVGRQRDGVVTGAEYDSVLAEVRAVLTEYVNPLTGRLFLADAIPRDKIHTGPAIEEAPDLIMEPADWRYLAFGDMYWVSRVTRWLQSGWHRRDSFWGGVGPAFVPGSGGAGSLTDVMPTIAQMLDLPAFADTSGTPLGHAPGGPAPTWR